MKMFGRINYQTRNVFMHTAVVIKLCEIAFFLREGPPDRLLNKCKSGANQGKTLSHINYSSLVHCSAVFPLPSPFLVPTMAQLSCSNEIMTNVTM